MKRMKLLLTGMLMVALVALMMGCPKEVDPPKEDPKPTEYTLTVTAPTNGTIVVKNGEKVLDGLIHKVAKDTTLTLTATATAADGFTFNGWTGASTASTADIAIKMDANKTIGATFVAAGKPVTVLWENAEGVVLAYNDDVMIKKEVCANFEIGTEITLEFTLDTALTAWTLGIVSYTLEWGYFYHKTPEVPEGEDQAVLTAGLTSYTFSITADILSNGGTERGIFFVAQPGITVTKITATAP